MSEFSPELAARIESLRASHAENPARFFMPLASAYREAGEVGKAEELLRENLKRHPGYLSAHVLLGRCLADRGATAEARNEFQYVLSVDPQNLIALRTLGEMAAAGGEPDEARRWFGELLSVDPMNAEARQSLAALDAAPAAGSEGDGFGMVDPGAAAAPAEDHPAAHADPGSWGEVSLDEPAGAPAGAAPAGESAPASFEALDFGAVDLSASAEAPAEEPAAELAASDASVDASAEPSAPEDAAAEDAGGAGGFDAWGSVDDGQDQVDAGAVEPLELEELYDGTAGPAPAPHGEEHDEQGEVVTETIAELYARQGFPERAADVYRELVARRGEEPALVRRLQELEEQVRAAAAGGEEARFEPIDLPGEAAAAQADEPPSWLATVDAVVAGDLPAGAQARDEGGPVDFQPDEPIAAVEEPAAAAAPTLTGDAFADSFANGFAGFASAPERREWEAPRVEETSPDEEPAAAEVFAEAEETSAAAEAPAPQARGESIVSYLSAILSWRPGGLRPESAEEKRDAEGAAPPSEPADAAAPPPARPWDEETLGASDQQPPVDEPWLAGADAPSADAPSADAPSADAPAADEPWAVPAEAEPWAETPQPEAEPWAAAEEQGEELPWLAQDAGAGEPPAPAPPAGEAPMPWETSFELSPEVPEGTASERPAPRQEPTADPGGGFSFEDFFSEPAAPAQPEPEPEPEPAPLPEPIAPPAAAQSAAPAQPAQPQAAEASEEDEDLESFQAWLQSLKR
ncbi:MAG: tetratricopeptide repeat protein [Longimicrobiaceae bacterium]